MPWPVSHRLEGSLPSIRASSPFIIGKVEYDSTQAELFAEVGTQDPEAPMVYVVEPGDTLSSISIQFDVPAADIVAANQIADEAAALRILAELDARNLRLPAAG